MRTRSSRNSISICSSDRALETKKPAAGGGAAGFSKRTEQRLGGGVTLFQQTSLGRSGPSEFEALREEMHRFDGFNHTPTMDRANVSCCTAAMQEIQVGKAGEQNKVDLRGIRCKTPASPNAVRLERDRDAGNAAGGRAMLDFRHDLSRRSVGSQAARFLRKCPRPVLFASSDRLAA